MGPSKWWFGVAALIGVVGIVVGTWLAVAAAVAYFDRIDDFQRFNAPGSGEIELQDAGGYTIYFESPFLPEDVEPDVEFTVEPSDGGAPLRLRDYGSDVSYSHGDVDGRAMRSFRIEEPGTYRVTASGELGQVAVGRGLGTTVRPGLVGIAISVLCVLVAAVLALVVVLRRISAKRRFPPPQYQPAA